jgi:hypothetical protein
MAYSNPWNETAPLGSAARNTVDDIIRQLKVDLRERFEATLFVDFSADPLVFKATKHLTIDGCAGFAGTNAGYGPLGITNSVDNDVYASLPLPVGAIIKRIAVTALRNGVGGAITIALEERDATGAATTLTSVAFSASPGVQEVISVDISAPVVDKFSYRLKSFLPVPAVIYFARVEYE